MAFCQECGNALQGEGVSYCPQCGTRVSLSPVDPASQPIEQDMFLQSSTMSSPDLIRIPSISIVLVAVGAIISAFSFFQYEPLYTYHPPLQRLVIIASGLCFVVFGIGSLFAYRWASSKSHGVSSILIGVGLILSGAWYLTNGVAAGVAAFDNSLILSNQTQNIATTVTIAGWLIVAVGVFLTLRRATTR